LNGEKLDIKNFRDYCDLYLPFWACLKHGFPWISFETSPVEAVASDDHGEALAQ